MKKFIIIGGGIIGCSLAREMAERKMGDITLLEKDDSLGAHASGRNSCVVHSGINQKPGSVKAQMCVEGNRLIREFCQKRNIPHRQCGTMVVSRTKKEDAVLDKMIDMGNSCGVPNLRFLNIAEVQQSEPRALGTRALFSPTGLVVDPLKLINAIANDAKKMGVNIVLNEKVKDIKGQEIVAETRTYHADHIINCAGLFADKIAHMTGIGLEYKIFPFRGEYMEVDDVPVSGMIYQVPDLRFPFLSVHLTKDVDGRVLAGPTAVLSFGRESYNKEFVWRDTFEMFVSLRMYKMTLKPAFLPMAIAAFKMSLSKNAFRREIEKLVGPIEPAKIRPFRSGIRAQMVDSSGNLLNDFVVKYSSNYTHILNCVSPGMTSSMAFVKHVAEEMKKNY